MSTSIFFISRCLFWNLGLIHVYFHLFSQQSDLWTSDEELDDLIRNFSTPEKVGSLTEVSSPHIHPLKWKIILFKQPISQCKYSLVVPYIFQKNVESIKKVNSRTGQQEAAPEGTDNKKKGKCVTFRLSPSHEKKSPGITPTEQGGEDSNWIDFFREHATFFQLFMKFIFPYLENGTVVIITSSGLFRRKKEEK